MLLALAACGSPPPAREPADAHRLDGEWTVDFTLESPLLPGRMPPDTTVRGRIALLRNATLAANDGLSGRPTHSGSYAASFRPFGFETGGAAPALEARLGEADSVEITLQPGGDAAVHLHGVLAGDSVAGTWMYDHYRAGMASGRFVMRRPRGGA